MNLKKKRVLKKKRKVVTFFKKFRFNNFKIKRKKSKLIKNVWKKKIFYNNNVKILSKFIFFNRLYFVKKKCIKSKFNKNNNFFFLVDNKKIYDFYKNRKYFSKFLFKNFFFLKNFHRYSIIKFNKKFINLKKKKFKFFNSFILKKNFKVLDNYFFYFKTLDRHSKLIFKKKFNNNVFLNKKIINFFFKTNKKIYYSKLKTVLKNINIKRKIKKSWFFFKKYKKKSKIKKKSFFLIFTSTNSNIFVNITNLKGESIFYYTSRRVGFQKGGPGKRNSKVGLERLGYVVGSFLKNYKKKFLNKNFVVIFKGWSWKKRHILKHIKSKFSNIKIFKIIHRLCLAHNGCKIKKRKHKRRTKLKLFRFKKKLKATRIKRIFFYNTYKNLNLKKKKAKKYLNIIIQKKAIKSKFAQFRKFKLNKFKYWRWFFKNKPANYAFKLLKIYKKKNNDFIKKKKYSIN